MSTALAYTADEAQFNRALAHLKSLNRKAFLTYAIEVGTYIVHEFFDGNFAALHDKTTARALSFRAFLVERKADLGELDLSAATLRGYVAAAEVAKDLPHQVAHQLGLANLSQLAVVGLPEERKRMAHEAADLHLTKLQVAKAVKDWKTAQRRGKRKPGPKHRPAVLKAAVAAHSAIKALAKLHHTAAELSEESKAALAKEIAAARAVLAAIV